MNFCYNKNEKLIEKSSIAIYAICFLWVTVLLFQYISFKLAIVSEERILNLLGLSVLIFSSSLIVNFRKKLGSYLSIYIIFYIFSLFFLQGQIILAPFNLLTEPLLHGNFNLNTIIKATFIVQISMISFGVACATCSNKKINGKIEQESIMQGLKWVVIIMALCSVPFYTITMYERLVIAMQYGYTALYQNIGIEAVGSYTRILGNFFMPACLFSIPIFERNHWIRKLAIINIIIYTIVMVAIGYRATGVFPLLAALWSLNCKEKIKKINFRLKLTLILVVILAILIFPIIKEVRANPSANFSGINIFKIIKENNLSDYFSVISEMGGTLKTVCYTLLYLSEGNNLLYGKSYILALTTIVPNIFGTSHLTAVLGGLGDLITKKYSYNFYLQGGSFGFSFVAECLINFGILGVIILSFIVAKILLKVEMRAAKYKHKIYIGAFSVFASYLFFYPRAEFEYLVRPLFWYTLLPLYIAKFIAMVGKKKIRICFDTVIK